MKIDWQTVEPYLIKAEFDDRPEEFGDGVWAIMADVNIGNKLLIPHAKSITNKLTRRIPKDGSMNGDFGFIVCSPKFKANPKEEYRYNLAYIQTAYVQENFDKADAMKYLENKVNSIGRVDIETFTRVIHGFLTTEEWDYLSQME